MSHLIIDLEKASKKLKQISTGADAVFLFTKRVRTRQIAEKFKKTYQSAEIVHLEKKVAKGIGSKLKDILKNEPTAHIIVVSKRKKMVKVIDKLLNRYPDASIMLMEQFSEVRLKKTDRHNRVVPVMANLPIVVPEDDLVSASVQVSQIAEQNVIEAQQLQQAIYFLKKNHPKKKAILVQNLVDCLHINVESVLMLIEQLITQQIIQIDKAENVKYY